MNINRIKQLFVAFVQRLPSPGMDAPSENGTTGRSQMIRGPLLVRGNLVLRDEAAVDYLEMLDQVSEIVGPDATWSRASLDDLLVECIVNVATAPFENRTESIRNQADRLVTQLKTSPNRWNVDMAVAGLSSDCAGLVFGSVQFLLDTVQNHARLEENGEPKSVSSVFARICVEAIDTESARNKAGPMADQHLAVLNALFSDWQPSRIHLFRGEAKPVFHESITRTAKVGDQNATTNFGSKLTGTILSRNEWSGFLSVRGGSLVSQLLMKDDTFARRVIAGYVTAGTACVESKPDLAFLLFAIALESVILGKQAKTEITYQLSARVAHLLAQTLDQRRSLVKQVNDLYRLRSAIVHSGKNDVSETDAYSIRSVCLRSLQTLATSPNFTSMNGVEELDQWFADQLLGGS